VRRLFCLLSILVATPASAEWWEARTDHFIIYSKSGEADTRKFAEGLERFDQSLSSLQQLKPDVRLSDSRRVKIYRAGTYVEISKLAGDSEAGYGGFYIPYLEPVAFVPVREPAGVHNLDARTTLFHEYTHHFMFRHFTGTYPSWYIEGIAELYSTIEFKPNGAFHLGNPNQARADDIAGKYRNMLHYSVRQMLTTTAEPTGEDAYARYTYGWLLTHYLAFEPSRKGQMLTYLRLIDKGTNAADAAQQAFGDLGKLETEVNRYRDGGKFYGKDVAPATYRPPEIAMRKLGPDEEAILPIVTRTKVGVSKRTARDVAADARAVAARYPTSFPVQLELTEAELDAENFDAAERAGDAAVALRPDSAEALYFRGMAALAKGKADPRQYAIARSWFARAHDADVDHPGPLLGNFLTYSKAGGPIPENAVIGLENAYRIAPQDDELKTLLAREELAERRLDVAKMLLVPMALSPHESKQAKALSEVVAEIDANRGPAALTKIDAWMKKAEEEKKKGG
jgi:tetratricopeptide (TPR) repeat protein